MLRKPVVRQETNLLASKARLRPGDVKNGPDDAGADELEEALRAEMGDEGPPKMDGGFSADSNFEVGVLVMQTAVNVNADAEWDGVSQTIKEGLGKVHDVDEADQKELEQENKALAA